MPLPVTRPDCFEGRKLLTKKSVLAICDADERYVRKLAEYLSLQDQFPMEVKAFTDPHSLADYALRAPPHMLLAGEAVDTALLSEFETVRVCRISDEKESAAREDAIYRYQSKDRLMEAILERYGFQGESSPDESLLAPLEGETAVWGVGSPLGRCGKTFFAVALGEILAEKGRALYIGLEDYHALSVLGTEDWNLDLSDLIYQYRLDREKTLSRFERCIRRFTRLEYIPPSFSPEDLRDVKAEEWVDFIRLIMETGMYRNIILDLGSREGSVPQLAAICCHLYVPTLADPVSSAKLDHFRQRLQLPPLKELEDKISYVKVPQLPYESMPLTGTQLVRGRIGSYIRHNLKNGQLSMEREW